MTASQSVLGFTELNGDPLPVSVDIIELGWFSWQLASNILSKENVLKILFRTFKWILGSKFFLLSIKFYRIFSGIWTLNSFNILDKNFLNIFMLSQKHQSSINVEHLIMQSRYLFQVATLQ